MRIGTGCLVASILLGAGALADGAARPAADIQLAQSRADDDRRREEERERRIEKQREERREERESEARERERRWDEERRERQDRATDDLKRRREEEIRDRFRRMEEGYETTEERRRRAAQERRLGADHESLRLLFPPEWIPGILAGRVEAGWNANAVIASLGRPVKITRTEDGTEVWHYPAARVVFAEGKVTAFRAAPIPPDPGP